MKPLYLVGTQRDIGKTTMSLGLLKAFSDRGLKVAYIKPLGQRISGSSGQIVHDDARLVANFLGLSGTEVADMAIPLPSGRVEKEVMNLNTLKLADEVAEKYAPLARDNDAVIIEAMGHVAMGSCLGLSAADVAKRLGARCLLVSGGGIGRALDEISLCATFIQARGADFLGVVINKVWPEKFDRIQTATTCGLKNLGYPTFGTIPFEKQLSAPTMEQVYHLVGGKILAGADGMGARVMHTIVAAMEAGHMVPYIKDSTLVITPGDRIDNILGALSSHLLADRDGSALAGILLTGGFRPDEPVMNLISGANVPVILIDDDTYSATSKLRETVFKITPDDCQRFEWAVNIIAKHVDIDGIIEKLQ